MKPCVVYGELDLPVGMLSSEAPEVPLTLPLEALKSEKIFSHSLTMMWVISIILYLINSTRLM